MIYLSKEYGLDVIGKYGIIISSISFIVYLSGAELYSVLIPRYGKNIKKDNFYFSNQLCFSVLSCLIIFTCSILFIEKDFYLFTIFLVALVEVISQEIYRLLLINGKAFASNVLEFIKSGSWAFFSLICIYIYSFNDPLFLILVSWFIFDVIGVVIFLKYLKSKQGLIFSYHHIRFNFLRNCIPHAIPLFSGAILIRITVTLDKLILSYFTSLANVGVYTFFVSISNAFQAIIDAGYVSRIYKSVILSSLNNNMRDFLITLARVLFICIISIIPLSISSYLFFMEFNFNEYKENIALLILILLSATFFSVNNIIKLFLSSMKKTKPIFISSLISFIAFIAPCFFLSLHLFPANTLMSFCLIFSSLTYMITSLIFIKRYSK
ncbi:hypothetical protein QS795_017035 [Providencia zhijiangensis]|uniref:Membrane protein involved in the export of O-antigen and teichoic acid n=1 Tax=Providencia zhijiangensis TaxID=3053982 RepID=A0ABZ0N167_9GAMM|nr:hypothetical protein [Providencia sp. D4759]WPA92125.1 hypothetical protein QS795_017035 [Providencia sp. D4759]